MLQTEFVRSMQCNYERILLNKKPEEKKYQYCILSRGGIKGLLPCSLRYLNGLAYLYYDITSKQSVIQLYGKRCITREWLRDFLWSLGQIQMELGRFLLDERNILWYPEHIFQELESNVFSFLYVPYYEGEGGFLKLLEYLVEHIDYEDESLVECVYKMYEQYERNGDIYLQAQIFEDAKILNTESETNRKPKAEAEAEEITESNGWSEADDLEQPCLVKAEENTEKQDISENPAKKGIRYLLDGRKRKQKNARESYRQNMQTAMEGYAVAEEPFYETKEESEDEEYGKTVYIEEPKCLQEMVRRLYTLDGRIVIQLTQETCTIGKKKDEVDLVLDDFSVSRMHARISREEGNTYLEDLNSTNGTYKNGIRLQPYEKKKLEQGDEIKIGKVELVYR